jgi:23S rRNA (adenine2503-C2)-methyltransferase
VSALLSQSKDELAAWMQVQGEPYFRAQQVLRWVYAKREFDWSRMTSLSLSLRDRLSRFWVLPSLTLLKIQESEDRQTLKFLWGLRDGKKVESVLILAPGRQTVCVSCQVGCPARCAFCASGREGLLRSLQAEEIIEQVLHTQKYLDSKGMRVSHVVFMGMGEPLENLDIVLRVVRQLSDPEGFGLSQRRITISTVGVLEGIERLCDEDLNVNLVFSLHAPNQHLRKKIIPYARRYPLDQLLEALRRYTTKTRREITYEYTLIHKINDQPAHALELVALLKGENCTVNLIPYNQVEGLRLERPKGSDIEYFRQILEEGGLRVTWRYTKGKDIAAACGQLALQPSSFVTVCK